MEIFENFRVLEADAFLAFWLSSEVLFILGGKWPKMSKNGKYENLQFCLFLCSVRFLNHWSNSGALDEPRATPFGRRGTFPRVCCCVIPSITFSAQGRMAPPLLLFAEPSHMECLPLCSHLHIEKKFKEFCVPETSKTVNDNSLQCSRVVLAPKVSERFLWNL